MSDNGIDLEPVRAWYDRWVWAREQKARAEQVEKEAREQLEAFIGDHETATLDGRPVISWKWSNPKNGRVSVSMLREKFPDIAAICTTKEPTRSFREIKEEG